MPLCLVFLVDFPSLKERSTRTRIQLPLRGLRNACARAESDRPRLLSSGSCKRCNGARLCRVEYPLGGISSFATGKFRIRCDGSQSIFNGPSVNVELVLTPRHQGIFVDSFKVCFSLGR